MRKTVILGIAVALLATGGVYLYVINRESPGTPASETNTEATNASGDLSSYYAVQPIRTSNATLQSIGLTAQNFPVLDGATSTQPIRSLIACEAFHGKCEWYQTEDKEMFLYPDLSASTLNTVDQDTVFAKTLKNSKTHDAYLKLIRREIDLILVSTKPSDAELQEAKKLGVHLELAPVGLDGFVFLVNKYNTVTNLNTRDIVSIYTGAAKNWKPFSGVDVPITAYTRPANSGSQELMEKLVMKGTAMDASLKQEQAIISMSALIEGVETDRNSLGYSLYYYKNNMIDKREIRPDVKLISVDGIEPNPTTIASHAYPYVFNIYAVTRADQLINSASAAYRIKEWLSSSEGQQLIEKAGYVGIGNGT